MKSSTLATSCLYLVLAMIVVASTGCRPNFGEKLEVNATEIYYKDGATAADAQRLADMLEEKQFIDGKRKSVQLTKNGNVWQFRLAVARGGITEAVKREMKVYGLELSAGFDGDPFETHLCNLKLESQAVVTGLRGKRYQLSNTIYYYNDLELEQVKNVAAIAVGTQLNTNTGYVFHMSQPETTIQVRMTHPTGGKGDQKLAAAAKNTAVAASSRVFDGKQVDVLICDPFFETQSTHSSVKTVAPVAAPAP